MATGRRPAGILGGGLLVAALLAGAAAAQTEPRRILVTLADPLPDPLTAVELDLRVAKKPAEVTRVYQPQERPVQLALLIDDSTGPEVANSLPELAAFLRSLPAGSEVMVAYLRRGNLDLARSFTTDLQAAASSLRGPSSNPDNAPNDLGQLITDALDQFPDAPAARAQILYVGGAVGQEDPYNNVSLHRAIYHAQQRGIVVWVIHMGSVLEPVGPAPQPAAGEQFLHRLAGETGGTVSALGLRPPTVGSYLDRLRALLNRQYLVEFTPPTDKNGQPLTGKLTMAVRGRKEVRLLHPAR